MNRPSRLPDGRQDLRVRLGITLCLFPLLLSLATARAQQVSGGDFFLVSTPFASRDFAFDFSTSYVLPAAFPLPTRSVSVDVKCPYDGVSAILNGGSQADLDSFKAAVKPTLLSNGLETATWSATCDGGKLTLHASSFSDLTRRLTFENSGDLNPYLLALASPAFFFVDHGHKLVLQGGNLLFGDNKITGSATHGAASIAVKQGDGPVQPLLLEMKNTAVSVDFSRPFLIVHSNEQGRLWRNYLFDLPRGSVTLWWSQDVGGAPLRRSP